MNTVLCGMMGCGKTSVAEVFAAEGKQVIDTDALIVQRYGNIDKIFAEHGESCFRDLEAAITAEVASGYDGAVISLGGGCVLREENVKNLKATGRIFYLRTSAEVIIERLKGDTSRPLLKGGLEERVHSILAARASVYESAADYIVDTDGLTPAQVARKIAEIMKGEL